MNTEINTTQPKKKTYRAFSAQPGLTKEVMVNAMKAHRAADRIAHVGYADNEDFRKGCKIGCGIQTINEVLGVHFRHGNHAALGENLDIPEDVLIMSDRIFENMDHLESLDFPVQFYEAIVPGADLQFVTFKLFAWLYGELGERIPEQKDKWGIRGFCAATSHLFTRAGNNEEVALSEWEVAAQNARKIYDSLTLALDLALDRDLALALALALDRALDLDLALDRVLALALDRALPHKFLELLKETPVAKE